MNTQRLGRFHQNPEGRYELTFERVYDHHVTKVWRALTDPEHLRSWFAQYLDYHASELDFTRVGAVLTFAPAPAKEQPPMETGQVLRSDPPTILEYTWGKEVLRWELTPLSDNACKLTFKNVFDDRSFAPFNAMGWHTGLDRLGAKLDGADANKIDLEVDGRAAERLQKQYEQALA